MNKVSLERTFTRTQIKSEQFKVFCVKNTGDYYTCYHSDYISNYKAFVKLINLEISKKPINNVQETTLSLLDNVIVYWSTNIHMKVLLLVKDVKEFWDGIRHELDIQHAAKNEGKYVQNLKINAQCDFHIEISQEHNAKISLGK